MPTVVTSTIGTSSRDYSTFALAEADIETLNGFSGDLVSNDNQIVFEAYNDSAFSGTLYVNGASRTTDSTRNVVFRAASGEQHDGTPGTGARIEWTSGGDDWLIDREDYLVIEGLSFSHSAPSGFTQLVHINSVSGGFVGAVVRKCVFENDGGSNSYVWGLTIKGQTNDLGSSAAPCVAENCVFYGFDTTGSAGLFTACAGGDCDSVVTNCTFVGCTTPVIYETASGDTLTVEYTNNLSVDQSSSSDNPALFGGNAGTETFTGANNFTEGTTNLIPGRGSPDPITGTTSTSPGAGDWAIYSGALDGSLVDDPDNDALDGGVGPASNSLVPTEDIIGETRSGTTTDPGAFQVPAAAGANDVDGTPTLGGPETSGSLEVEAEATGAPTLGGPATDGALEVETEGSGALTLGGPAISGSLEVFSALTGALTLSGVTTDASVAVESELIGAITLGSLETSGSITVVGLNTLTGAMVLGGLLTDGSTAVEIEGSGALTLGGLATDGSITLTGINLLTGALTLGGPETDGTASVLVEASGALELSGLIVDGFDEEDIEGRNRRAWLLATWIQEVLDAYRLTGTPVDPF